MVAVYLQSHSKKKISLETVMPYEYALQKPKSQEDLLAQIISGDHK